MCVYLQLVDEERRDDPGLSSMEVLLKPRSGVPSGIAGGANHVMTGFETPDVRASRSLFKGTQYFSCQKKKKTVLKTFSAS